MTRLLATIHRIDDTLTIGQSFAVAAAIISSAVSAHIILGW